MAKNNTWAAALVTLLFNNTDAANIGDSTGLQGSGTAGSLYISLHTADPGVTGNQTTSEAGYTGYGRVTVARSSAGFTVSGEGISNAAAVTFGACTASSSTCTYFGIGTATSGTGSLLYSGALTASLAVTAGITPSFSIGALTVTES